MTTTLESIANKRWKKCNIDELVGADYALRLFRTSPVLRGESLKLCEELINEVRTEINCRPEEGLEQAKRKSTRGFNVYITTCEDCPYKEWGLRKCEKADTWFNLFEIEEGIAPWCPVLKDGGKK